MFTSVVGYDDRYFAPVRIPVTGVRLASRGADWYRRLYFPLRARIQLLLHRSACLQELPRHERSIRIVDA